MKYSVCLLFVVALFVIACGGAKKSLKNQPAQKEIVAATPPVMEEPSVDSVPAAKEPILEKEENVIPVIPETTPSSRYFVIIGSFRNPEYATRYQKQILEEGFLSVLLKNEQGLIRVSVLGTNDILKARAEIRRIRAQFPRHSDTWLLIQKSEFPD